MATIYAKPTNVVPDNCLVLEPRESLVYPLPFKKWSTLKISVFWSWTNSDVLNGNLIQQENMTQTSSYRDKFSIGLKKSADSNFPLENNEYFWGISNIEGGAYIDASSNMHRLRHGVVYPDYKSVWASDWDMNTGGTNYSNTTSYLNRTAIYLNIGERAETPFLKNAQNVTMANHADYNISYQTPAQIRDYTLNGAGYQSWVDFITPKGDLPQAIFIYSPFLGMRIRIHSISAYVIK